MSCKALAQAWPIQTKQQVAGWFQLRAPFFPTLTASFVFFPWRCWLLLSLGSFVIPRPFPETAPLALASLPIPASPSAHADWLPPGKRWLPPLIDYLRAVLRTCSYWPSSSCLPAISSSYQGHFGSKKEENPIHITQNPVWSVLPFWLQTPDTTWQNGYWRSFAPTVQRFHFDHFPLAYLLQYLR